MILKDYINHMIDSYQTLSGETISDYTVSIHRKAYPTQQGQFVDNRITIEIAWDDGVMREPITDEFAEMIGIYQRSK